MAVSAKAYGLFIRSLMGKEANLASDTLKVMLCTSTYTPNQDTHRYKSDVTNEVSGTGYTATGATLANVTLTYDAATNTVILDADDTGWTGLTTTARYAVIYDATPSTDATRPLIAYVDFGADVAVTNGPLTLTWDSTGIVRVSAA